MVCGDICIKALSRFYVKDGYKRVPFNILRGIGANISGKRLIIQGVFIILHCIY